MVSVTCRLTTGVTETAGGGGAPWAAATPQEAATLSAQTAAFQATELRPGIEVLLNAGAISLRDIEQMPYRSATAYTCAKPPSTNNSAPVTCCRRMRETPRP